VCVSSSLWWPECFRGVEFRIHWDDPVGEYATTTCEREPFNNTTRAFSDVCPQLTFHFKTSKVAAAMEQQVSQSPPNKKARLSTTFRIFYDTETSGRGCSLYKQSRIIELAAVADWAIGTALTTCGLEQRKRSSKEVSLPDGYFSELVAGGPCTARAIDVHGLRDLDLLKHGRPFEDVWTSFVAFVHGAQKRAPDCSTAVSLVGHNSLHADNYWLLSELARCGRSVNDLALPGRRVVFEDTYPSEKHQKRLKEKLNSISLKNSDIHRALWPSLAIEIEKHTALWDAAATRDNWQNIHIRHSVRRLSSAHQQAKWAVLQAQNHLEQEEKQVDESDGEKSCG
jgi:hypothetical protein